MRQFKITCSSDFTINSKYRKEDNILLTVGVSNFTNKVKIVTNTTSLSIEDNVPRLPFKIAQFCELLSWAIHFMK